MTDDRVTRPLHEDDAAELAHVLTTQRAFMTPYEPTRDDGFFTVQGQAAALAQALHEREQGRALPLVIVGPAGGIAGRITLTGVVRGAFQSAVLGYWVRQDLNGQGIATAAVSEVLGIAFGELGLHRVEAGTLTDNLASQRVLAKNGFRRYGLAPRYLRIDGRWQDHVLFQRLCDEDG